MTKTKPASSNRSLGYFGWRAVGGLVVAVVSAYLLVSVFGRYWLRLQLAVSPVGSTPLPVATATTQPTANQNVNELVIIEEPVPTASLSATFLSDLIQAILEATATATAAAERQ